MGILVLKILGLWSALALVSGLVLGAAIERGNRVRRNVFVSCVFASLEILQGSRS